MKAKVNLVCLVKGHDWKETVYHQASSNVKEIDRYCRRCGKREKLVKPIEIRKMS